MNTPSQYLYQEKCLFNHSTELIAASVEVCEKTRAQLVQARAAIIRGHEMIERIERSVA